MAILNGTPGNDTLTGTLGKDSLFGFQGRDVLFGEADDDFLSGGQGADLLDGGTGSDTLQGGLGNDTFIVENAGDRVVENLDSGIDTVQTFINLTLGANIENLVLLGTGNLSVRGNELFNSITGNSGVNELFGGDGRDTILGGAGNDSLAGGRGADSLDGEIGDDTMRGGLGNDAYVVNSAGDVLIELLDEGIDTASSSVSYTITANIESLTLTGTADLNGGGNAIANTITGNAGRNTISGGEGNDTLNGLEGSDTVNGDSGDDTLDGGAGIDTLAGGIGNDTYLINDEGDVIVEVATPTPNNDVVNATVNYILSSNVETLVLTGAAELAGTGSADNNTIIGNGSRNVISGEGGNDLLDGRAGADTMQGGAGNDTFILDNFGDAVIENVGEGIDTVISPLTSYVLTANVENLTLDGTNNLNGIGNDLGNTINGNAGNNSLSGNAGQDVLLGGGGNDFLDGGLGDDSLVGGLGNDTYGVDSTADVILEEANGGTDTVNATASFFFTTNPTAITNLENLTLLGTDNINGGGDGSANTIVGNVGSNSLSGNAGNDSLGGLAGNDTLDGGAGSDTLVGGAGDDTYVVDLPSDIVVELANEGTDEVRSLSLVDLSQSNTASIENIVLLGTGNINAIANDLANTIVGNSGNNTLQARGGDDRVDGGGGADSMSGGTGNDTYIFDNAGDTATELAGAGTDDIIVTETFVGTAVTLSNNVENLTLTGTTNINIVGNTLNNTLNGNAGSNAISGDQGNDFITGGAGVDTLNGGAGNDTLNGGEGVDSMAGGAGDDLYFVDATTETVAEDLNAGLDTVNASATFTLSTNLEILNLVAGAGNINGTGNELNNTINGNEGDNALNGAGGSDRLVGGNGNDTYFVDTDQDVIVEVAGVNTGIDTVVSSLANYALGVNLENLTLAVGTANLNGSGNDGNNTITGNDGNNTLQGNAGNDVILGAGGGDRLDGGLGVDTLDGGLGNDTYVLTDLGDTLLETNPAGGIDTIEANFNLDLNLTGFENIENLTLIGAAISGTGNGLNNSIVGNANDNSLIGNAGDDTLDGGAGSDRLNGGVGNDTLIGGVGNDTYVVGEAGDVVTEATPIGGIDLVESSINFDISTPALVNIENITLTGTAITAIGNVSNNTILGNASNNILLGNAGDDRLEGNEGDDRLEGGLGNDLMIGGLGNDTYSIDSAGDIVQEDTPAGGIDTVESTFNVNLINFANVENIILAGTANIAIGNNIDNTIIGNDSDNTLQGLEGNDSLDGRAGNDVLDGGVGADAMAGGAGNDTFLVNEAGDSVQEAVDAGIDTVVSAIDFDLSLAGRENIENLGLINGALVGIGNAQVNTIVGTVGNNTLSGAAGNDRLIGDAGDDRLDGGVGVDTLEGGVGNDTYVVDTASDIVTEIAEAGVDTVESSVTLSLVGNVENLILTGTTNIDGTGNELNNSIAGNDGNNVLLGGLGVDTLSGGLGNDRLDGGAGTDTLIGGAGDDTYIVDDGGDRVTELLNAGTDLVESSVTFDLSTNGANVENLTLTGDAAINGTGNELNNIIRGNSNANSLTGGVGNDTLISGAGADYLDGGAGDDSMTGALGNDTYIVDSAADVVVEAIANAANGGIDLVISSVSFTLAEAGRENLDNLTLVGTAVGGVGNANINTIIGNDTSNFLDGGAGADLLVGGEGDDTYIVDNAQDAIQETGVNNIDLVIASVSYDLEQPGADAVENLTLVDTAIVGGGDAINNTITGNTFNNTLLGRGGDDTLIGGAGDDRLDGGVGGDNMTGGLGNDTYIVDSDQDIVSEANDPDGGGVDTVISSATVITIGDNIENLILVAGGIDGNGNAGNNTITGNEANNRLEGREGNDVIVGAAGADTMIGGFGDDIYSVDNAGDIIIDNAGQGIDRLLTTVSYTLTGDSEIEFIDLVAGTGNISVIANGTANTITGNEGNNLIDGGGGDDQMTGGSGNDTYGVDSLGDRVIEAIGGGLDTIQSSISYSLNTPNGENVENLTLLNVPTALNATGNGVRNTLIGNIQNNRLDGLAGDDTMIGGLGDDTYVVDNGSDTVTEVAEPGIDTVESSVSYILGLNLENLTLTGTASITGTGNELNNSIVGNSGVNTLSGNAGDDYLDGGVGGDALNGGDGNDTYVVDDAGDRVTEAANQGLDLVISTVSYSLTGNVENLTLSSLAANLNINGLGNASANTIIGTAGNNLLNGGAGVDTLIGGAGNDTYVVDGADSITEVANEGIDSVVSSVTYILSDNLENLTLTGTAAIDGVGNSADNTIIGNTANNNLSGGIGADTLVGDAGNDALDGNTGSDAMSGGTGNDTYFVNDGGDTVTEGADPGVDIIFSSIDFNLAERGVNVENLVLQGGAQIGTGNNLNNTITGNDANNTLNGGGGVDNLQGGAGNDTYFVDDSSDTIVELAGQGSDTVNANVTYTLSDNLENLTLVSGAGNINGFGNAEINLLIGNEGNNFLDGRAGSDQMQGGLGDDTYVVDSAQDLIQEGATAGIDTVETTLASYDLTSANTSNLENLELVGDGPQNGTGNSLNNSILGNDAINTLVGNAGDDVLTGFAGDDSLLGGLGNDSLAGGLGNDSITGGLGNDTLAGGAGNDSFIYDTGAPFDPAALGLDVINNFTSGTDKIVLDRTTFNAIPLVSPLPATAFTSVAADNATVGAGVRIVYNSTTGALFYDVNGGDGGGRSQFLTFTGNPGLAAADFLIQE